MIPTVRSFSNMNDLSTRMTSTITRSHSTGRLYLEGTHQELWTELEANSASLKNKENQNSSRWSLADIDRFNGKVISNPTGRALVKFKDVPIRVRGGETIQQPKFLNMNANYIGFDGQDIAIAAQYPTNISPNNLIPINMNEELCRHVHMLLNNRIPILIILVPEDEIKVNKDKMLPYFTESGAYDYGETQTRIKRSDNGKDKVIGEGKTKLTIASYHMNIIHGRQPVRVMYEFDNHTPIRIANTYKSRHSLPVMHVKNSPGRKGTFTADQLRALIHLVNEKICNQVLGGDSLPVIVDASGTGPAAQMIIAMHILEQAKTRTLLTDSVAQMVEEAREQRSSHMIETQKQFEALLDLLEMSRP